MNILCISFLGFLYCLCCRIHQRVCVEGLLSSLDSLGSFKFLIIHPTCLCNFIVSCFGSLGLFCNRPGCCASESLHSFVGNEWSVIFLRNESFFFFGVEGMNYSVAPYRSLKLALSNES